MVKVKSISALSRKLTEQAGQAELSSLLHAGLFFSQTVFDYILDPVFTLLISQRKCLPSK